MFDLNTAPERVVFKPWPKQWDLLSCPAEEILYGGAAGGGKTLVILFDFAEHERTYGADAVGLVIRKTYPELDEILTRAQTMFGQLPNPPKWVEGKKKFVWPSGGTLELGHWADRSDAERYIGREFTFVAFDELGHWATDWEWEKIKTRIRSSKGVKCRQLGTCNPGGPGHNWIMKRWQIDVHPDGYFPIVERTMVDGRLNKIEKIHTRIFFPARLEDNPALDQDGEYRAQLMRQDENTQKMLLYGRWDVIEGSFFPEFDTSVHVIRPRTVDPSWPCYSALDWGTSSPYAGLWSVYVPTGEIWIFSELYGQHENGKPNEGTRETVREVARKILDREKELGITPRQRWLDTLCFTDSGLSEDEGGHLSTADVFRSKGLIFEKSMKARKAGAITLLREYLSVTNKRSRLKIFSNCTNTIRTFQTIQHDPNDPQKYASVGDNHCLDTTLYLLRPFFPDEDQKTRNNRAKELSQRRMGVRVSPRGCQ